MIIIQLIYCKKKRIQCATIEVKMLVFHLGKNSRKKACFELNSICVHSGRAAAVVMRSAQPQQALGDDMAFCAFRRRPPPDCHGHHALISNSSSICCRCRVVMPAEYIYMVLNQIQQMVLTCGFASSTVRFRCKKKLVWFWLD
jgi:hypothetical protein